MASSIGSAIVGEDVYGSLEQASAFVCHQFNIHSIQTVGIPKIKQYRNQYDEHGSLLSLSRLKGEKNWSYKRRILDTMVNRANSSYRGLVNGITRELGLNLFNALQINPRKGSNGSFLASDPYILFDGAYLFLYSDYKNNILEYKLDRYQPGGNYEHLYRLVNFINTTTTFEANILPGIDPYLRSMSILHQSNRQRVSLEFIPQSTKFKTKHSHLINGTVFFANRNTFRQEVSSLSGVTRKGLYHIDYLRGIVTCYVVPDVHEYVRYEYTEYPFRPVASPVILNNINSNHFRVKLFQQVLQDDGTCAHGLPTELGVDIINELMSVIPMYWGI